MNQMRRLPWTQDGKPAFVTAGTHGPVTQLADQMERQACAVAEDLATQATRLARDMSASAAEMRPVLALLAASVKDVVMVAQLRAERLDAGQD
ncbi:hypothetical protein PV661_02705 [Streptomyces sp. MD20-1-1]|uniref:hypothetical protein n=1 Tax=Streptomyces sp. MD20-1-1 TaxID=3028668 RepID=UPI0029A764DA|nr:hypothetical protein [Streptomyces sp. MD20-1-1]